MNRRMGLALLLLLVLHGLVKIRAGQPWELLWLCHLASGALALGLLLDLPAVTAMAFLFHLAVAVPTYAVHLAVGGDTNWTSALLHALTPLAGGLAWRGRRLPPAAPWHALAFCAAGMAASRALAPAALNLNLAFAPWPATAFLGLWANRAGDLLLAAGLLLCVQGLLDRRRFPELRHA